MVNCGPASGGKKAFRISKTDLAIRPIYHHLKRRIEAHVCIAFAAYKVFKELERQLATAKSSISAERAIEIANTIYAISVINPVNKEFARHKLPLNKEQKTLMDLFAK